MLVKKDCSCKGLSKFMCDRCKTELIAENKRAIYVQYDKYSPKKRWDLCLKCFSSLKRGIEKGKN